MDEQLTVCGKPYRIRSLLRCCNFPVPASAASSGTG